MFIVNAAQVPEIYTETKRILDLIENNICMRISTGELNYMSMFWTNIKYLREIEDTKIQSLTAMAHQTLLAWRKDARKLQELPKNSKIDVEDLEAFLETASPEDKIFLDEHMRKMYALYFSATRVLETLIKEHGNDALCPATYSAAERAEQRLKFKEQKKAFDNKFRADGGITF